jgi:type IV pilus assembly protein PilM
MPDDKSALLPVEKAGVSPELRRLQKSLGSGRTVIGIDIGNSSVKVVQTALVRGIPTIIKAVIKDIASHHEADREKAANAALRKALSEFPTRNAVIVCVLPCNQGFVDNISMPLMPQEELPEAVKLVISGTQRFAVENPVIDFTVIGHTFDKGVERMSLIVAATAKTAIERLVSRFVHQKNMTKLARGKRSPGDDALGLELTAVIPVSIAVENVVKKSMLRMDETIAVVAIGTVATELNIYHNSMLEFSRQLPVTGHDLIRCLTRSLFTVSGKIELSFEQAGEVLREYGIPTIKDNFLVDEKITSGQILALLRPSLEQLATEIDRSLGHYYEKKRAIKVNRIILFGSGAAIKGLPEFLNAEIDVPVYIGNPIQDIELLDKDVMEGSVAVERLAVAIGASLWSRSGINLLPAQFRNRRKRSLARMAITAAALLFAVSLGFVFFKLQSEMVRARAATVEVAEEYRALVTQLEARKNNLMLLKLLRNRMDVSGLFQQLSALSPNVYLTELSVRDNKVRMIGFVVGEEKQAQEEVVRLLIDLQKGIMSSANLVSTKHMSAGPASLLF